MNFLTVFVRPPGDLIYYVLIVAVIMACLLMAAGYHMRHGTPATRRLAVGIGGAFAAWLLLMGGALVTVVGSGGGLSSLQALERAANLLMILSLGWAYLTADSEEWGPLISRAVLVLAAAVIVLLILTGGSINNGLSQASEVVSGIWLIAPIALLVAGVVIASRRWSMISDAPLKTVFAGVLLSGYTAALVQYLRGDEIGMLGAMRLAFAAAVGLTAMIVYRALLGSLVAQLRTAEQAASRRLETLPRTLPAPATAPERPAPQVIVRHPSASERESVQLLRALGLMIEDTQPVAVPSQIVRAALEMLRADVGALIRVQDANYADIVVGFDRARKRIAHGLAVNLSGQPTLQNAIERLQQRPLFPDRNQAELDDLYTRLGVEQTGPAYFQPLTREGELKGVLLIGFPFSDREMSEAESEALKGMAVIAAGLLALSDAAEEARLLAEERAIQAMAQGVPISQVTDDELIQARQSALAELQSARAEIDGLTDQVRELEVRVNRERERLAMALGGETDEDLSISQRISVLSQQQLALREERNELAQKLHQMESALSGAAPAEDDSTLRSLIASLQREREDLVAQRQRLEAQLAELRAVSGSPNRTMAAQAVFRMDAEQSDLAAERDQLRSKFEALHDQLAQFGLDGSPSGIAHLISQLYSERSALQARITTLSSEKDTLAQERAKLNQRLSQLRESEHRIQHMQREVQNVAADHEVIAKQRDTYKAQRDELVTRFEAVKKFRERMLDRVTMLETQLRETQGNYVALTVGGDMGGEGISVDLNALVMEMSRAASRIAELEREVQAAQSQASRHLDEPGMLTDEETDTLMGLVQELRTPITSMRGYVDLLLKETVGILGEMQRRFLQRVASNVTRLSGMIEDLVRLGALDAGRVQLQHEPVDWLEVIEEAVSEVTVPLREKGIEVSLDLAGDVPELTGDREAIKQIALQLLTNAYLVTPTNSVLQVTAAARAFELENDQLGPGAWLMVEDRGGGVAPEDEARVFQRHYHGENPLVPGLGDTGVGLALAKALVELHHGRIWVESMPGVGTRIHVHLPATGEE